MAWIEPEEQLRILKRISEEIIPEEEFLDKARRAAAEDRPLRIKYGLDPTAPDIHLGNGIALHKLAVFQELGHLPVIIVGDYTARVGDPSERNRTRPVLTGETIDENAKTYFDQVGKIVDLDRAEIRRNGEWFEGMTLADVVKLASRATVARMTERDDFSKRLAEGTAIGVHELLYPIMQAWDSVMVEADVEIGGTDQKFNFLAAREYQKAEGQEPQVIMTHPLLVGLDGVKKMSKSLGNYIGITEDPVDIFGKAMSLPDELMANWFLWVTDVTDDEIAVLLDPARTHPRDAKEALGRAIVERYYEPADADRAAAAFRKVFAEKQVPDDMPEIVVPAEPIWIAALVVKAGFAKSNGEARRLVDQGAVSLDGEKVTDSKAEVTPAAGQVLKVGKRRFARIRTT
ncbi:MAG: tyrosine--tRNA ligase [Planctomycetota bacterium]